MPLTILRASREASYCGSTHGASWKISLVKKVQRFVVLDPAADGSMNVSAVVSLRKKFPELPVIAYVPLSPQSLNAAGTLSRHNVTQFLLHPQDGGVRRFRCALERAAADTVTSQFLGCLEAALGRFPFRLMLSVQDLFDRPGRYETALDFADQCGVPLKTVYRWFEDGRIGTPKKVDSRSKGIARVLLPTKPPMLNRTR